MSLSTSAFRQLGFDARSSLEELAEASLVCSSIGQSAVNFPAENTKSTFLIVASPDGRCVASSHGNHSVYVTEVASRRVEHELKGHTRTPWALAYHPARSDLLASGCLAGQVRVWDLNTGCCSVLVGEQGSAVASLAFHPDSRLLAIATGSRLLFWDWKQAQPKAHCYAANGERVRYVKFDFTGFRLYTAITNIENDEESPIRAAPLEMMPNRCRELLRTRREFAEGRDELSERHRQLLRRFNELNTRYEQLRNQYPDLGVRPVGPALEQQPRVDEDHAPRFLYRRSRPLGLGAAYSLSSAAEEDDVEGFGEPPLDLRHLRRPLSPIRLERLDDMVSYAYEISRTSMERFLNYHQMSMARLQRSYLELSRSTQAIITSFRHTYERIAELQERIDQRLDRTPGLTASTQDPARTLIRSLARVQAILVERAQQLRGDAPPLERETATLIDIFDSLLSNGARQLPEQVRQALERSKTRIVAIRQRALSGDSDQSIDELQAELTRHIQSFHELIRNWKRIVLSSLQSQMASGSAASSNQNPSSATDPVGSPPQFLPLNLQTPDQPVENPPSTGVSASTLKRRLDAVRPAASSGDPASSSSSGQAADSNMPDVLRLPSRGTGQAPVPKRTRLSATASQTGEASSSASRETASEVPPAAAGTSAQGVLRALRLTPGQSRDQPLAVLPGADNELARFEQSRSARLAGGRSFPLVRSGASADVPRLGEQSANQPSLSATLSAARNQGQFYRRAMDLNANASRLGRADVLNAAADGLTRARQSLEALREEMQLNAGQPEVVVSVRDQQMARAHEARSRFALTRPNQTGAEADVADPDRHIYRAVNRAIAGAFIGTGDIALANNILDLTCRIQEWPFTPSTLPDLLLKNANVVAPRCKMHNDGSIALSGDGQMLACFAENVGDDSADWANTALHILSLRPLDRGAILFRHTFGPNAVSVAFSPAGSHVMVGLASRRYLRLRQSPLTVAEVYRLCSGNESIYGPGLKLVLNLKREPSTRLTGLGVWPDDVAALFAHRNCSLNCAAWLPTAGQGFVYGTNKGQLHLLTPSRGPDKPDDGADHGADDPFDPIDVLRTYQPERWRDH